MSYDKNLIKRMNENLSQKKDAKNAKVERYMLWNAVVAIANVNVLGNIDDNTADEELNKLSQTYNVSLEEIKSKYIIYKDKIKTKIDDMYAHIHETEKKTLEAFTTDELLKEIHRRIIETK